MPGALAGQTLRTQIARRAGADGTNVYILRDDAATQTLRLELTGEVTTAEAARAVSQALALAEAGAHSRVVCDLTAVECGPDELEAVAALLKSRALAFRVAFVGPQAQLRVAVRLAELAGIERSSGAFSNTADADAWLARPTSANPAAGSETVRRHLQQQPPDAQPRARAAKRVEPAA